MRSKIASDILGKDPPSLIRWGIASMLSFLLMLLVLSNIIAYPDINIAQVEVTAKSAPIPLYARVNGYIKHVFVNEGDTVSEGDILALINNSADLDQVQILSDWLNNNESESINEIISSDIPNLKQLGNLQVLYNDLCNIYSKACQYIKSGSYHSKMVKAQNELSYLKELLCLEEKKYNILQKEYRLLKINIDRNRSLYKSKLISSADMESLERILLQKEMSIEQLNANRVNIKLKINSSLEKIVGIKNAHLEFTREVLLSYNNQVKELKVGLSNWKESYLITANTEGKIAFFKKIEDNEFVNTSDHILTVLPIIDQNIYATGLLPIINSGKVKLGQKVNIKLDDFPYREYGMLKGKLIYISQTQSNGYYAIRILITEGLSFDGSKDVEWFKAKMLASADIITDNLTVFQRLIIKFRKVEIKQ